MARAVGDEHRGVLQVVSELHDGGIVLVTMIRSITSSSLVLDTECEKLRMFSRKSSVIACRCLAMPTLSICLSFHLFQMDLLRFYFVEAHELELLRCVTEVVS